MDINDLLGKLGLNQLLRYAYGGGLLIFFAYIFRPDKVGKMIESMGVIFAPLFFLGVGVVVYVFNRNVIGEYVAYPIIHIFHFVWDKLSGRNSKEKKITSPTSYLNSLGIKGVRKYFVRREAYTTIRRLFNFDKPQHNKLREKLDIAHAKHHVLWITIYILILVGIYMVITKAKPVLFSTIVNIPLIIVVIVILFFGAIATEILQLQYECRIIKVYNTTESEVRITKFLKEYGFINIPKEKK